MIDHLDNLLRDLFMSQIGGLPDEAQVRFQPPDEAWRNHVTNLEGNALNVYLADLRENRKLRSNERVREMTNGMVNEAPAPRRMDCHYLITAWSPASVTTAVEPTADEHALLYAVTGVLAKNEPLNPSRIYPDGSAALNAVPELIRNADLPTQLLPVEGFPKYAEFWGTMGVNHRWKPAVYLVVTLPVELEKEVAGPMVTTRITEYRQTGKPVTAKVWIQIGGQVLDATQGGVNPPVPLAGIWVLLETLTGERLQTTQTSELGRFTFGRLRVGSFRLRTQAMGLGEITRDVDVPSPSGEYDLRFI